MNDPRCLTGLKQTSVVNTPHPRHLRRKLAIVAGARPNFMKVAPIIRALRKHEDTLSFSLVHTGQHYDHGMNNVFFDELGIPKPDVCLSVGSGSHAQQTGKIMLGFEEFCRTERPDLVIVVGDVNSTLACSIVAKKENIPVAHVEAGLRSGDMAMPEEINRIVTDSISDLLFVTEPSGVENLRREGKSDASIHYVGHVMVDNLLYQRDRLQTQSALGYQSTMIKREHARYGVVTLHRPALVDNADAFAAVAGALRQVSVQLPLVFPMHPRTRSNAHRFNIDFGAAISVTEPLSYMDFLNLWKDAAVVLTDSGGLQEETTALGVPCLTLRDNTERPVTVSEGTNEIVGMDPARIIEAAINVLDGNVKTGRRPSLWDGHAADRIVQTIETSFTRQSVK